MDDFIAPPSLVMCRMATVLSVLTEKITQVKRPNLVVTHPKSAYGKAAEFLTNRQVSTQEERDYLCKLWRNHILLGMPMSTLVRSTDPIGPRPSRKFPSLPNLDSTGTEQEYHPGTNWNKKPNQLQAYQREIGIQCNLTGNFGTDACIHEQDYVQRDECPYYDWNVIYCHYCRMPLCVNAKGELIL